MNLEKTTGLFISFDGTGAGVEPHISISFRPGPNVLTRNHM